MWSELSGRNNDSCILYLSLNVLRLHFYQPFLPSLCHTCPNHSLAQSDITDTSVILEQIIQLLIWFIVNLRKEMGHINCFTSTDQ